MIREALHELIDRQNLTKHASYTCFMEIMSGTASEAVIAAFLTALRIKGETVPEIAGAAQAMREMAVKVATDRPDLIDTCGTGGDGLGTYNISTTAALIAAAAGAAVAKHGNRAVSSRSGSADVLKALGVNIELPKEGVERCLQQVGIAFLFAPMMHGAMKYAAPVRKELGIRTIFNILGPLTNPAGARRQLLGVYRATLTDVMAQVLLDLGTEKALIVHGSGGMDEISTAGETKVTEIRDGHIESHTFDPVFVGIPVAELKDIMGGDAEENARLIRGVLEGRKGAHRDIALLNAGAALYVAGRASSIADGVRLAADAVDTGAARRKLNELIDFTRQ